MGRGTIMTISNPTAPVPAYMMRIRNQIRAAEAKADESLLAKLDVMSSILRARQIEDIPAPNVGHEAIIRLGRALKSEIRGANDVFGTHTALVDATTTNTVMSGHADIYVLDAEGDGRNAVASRLTEPTPGGSLM